MITPRRTRLIRVPDLHTFRLAVASLSVSRSSDRARSHVVIVATRSAARQAARTAGQHEALARLVTREDFYDILYDRLTGPPPRLTAYARDAMMQSAARDASTRLGSVSSSSRDDPSARLGGTEGPLGAEASAAVRLRPGLVAEMLRFYDQLRRQGRSVARFEELLDETLAKEADYDRGAERMLVQARILAATFHGYERRVAESGACDEHTLRGRLLAEEPAEPIRHIVVTVGDWIADPSGLYLADFDLLTRLPGAEAVDIVATAGLLAAGFDERVHEWLPGIEESAGSELGLPSTCSRPTLLVPDTAVDQPYFVVRDREEELVAIARRIAAGGEGIESLERTAVVFKRPLPYLYLAREVFGGAGVPYQTADALPLAAEPFAAALDLVLELVESGFTRQSLVALLGSPHFVFDHDGQVIDRAAVSALDRLLSGARYLGGLDRLAALAATAGAWAGPAVHAGCRLAGRLSQLLTPAPASAQLRILLTFVDDHSAPTSDSSPLASRARRAHAAVREALASLEQAYALHDDAPIAIGGLAAEVRRWIEEQTFDPDLASGVSGSSGAGGLQLIDDQAARYGEFDDISIVGMIEREWPERPRRNIFYPSVLLMKLGWPSERDRRAADEARFLDLLASARRHVSVFTVTLDDETLVEPSAFVDDIIRAHLSSASPPCAPPQRLFTEEALSLEPVSLEALDLEAREWAGMRLGRSSAADPVFHGTVSAARAPRAWSVSALETYLDCPFKFFARYVLRLEEEPEDEEVMDPRRQGAFVHGVFEAFFERWQGAGHQAITVDNIETARAMFVDVVDERLACLSEAEAGIERTRLLGSPAAAGLGDAVLRMEAERPVPVVGRKLEYRLDGEFVFASAHGPRTVSLRGKADRVDLLADGTFRLIDYKLGWPPNKARALQLPIYGLCVEQQLDGDLGRHWSFGEAVYLAFKGPKRVVPLVGPRDDRNAVLAQAQQRLIDTIDGIDRGEFPPRPDDIYRCETCSYSAVCRTDYVDDF